MGFTDVVLLRISESVRAYAFLILSSQASARSSIVGNSASSLTAQSAFLNNFEDIVNQKVDVRKDIKRYQDTLSYASSKVNYNIGEHLYMLPSDMELRIRPGTVGYNNKILVSDGKFNLGKKDKVNLIVPVIKSHEINSIEPTTITTTQGFVLNEKIFNLPYEECNVVNNYYNIFIFTNASRLSMFYKANKHYL